MPLYVERVRCWQGWLAGADTLASWPCSPCAAGGWRAANPDYSAHLTGRGAYFTPWQLFRLSSPTLAESFHDARSGYCYRLSASCLYVAESFTRAFPAAASHPQHTPR